MRVPTLVVHGDRDPAQSLHAARETVRAIPGARLKILPNVGHYLPAELFPGIVDELRELLRDVEYMFDTMPE